MSQHLRHGLLLAAVALVALGLRLHELGARPMHADEANQAVKLGMLLEGKGYAFDPRDHHGPTLYFLGLVPAWLTGTDTLAGLTEKTVRITPAFFSTLSVVLIWALALPLGRRAALTAALLLAVSPPAVYYGRYFIQESLLVAFALAAFACAFRWLQRGGARWAACAGACAGLMLATKALAPVLLAGALLAVFAAGRGGRLRSALAGRWREAVVGAGTALAVAGAFYSSFGTNWTGLRDAMATFLPMLDRAAGGVTGHEKPWWYFGSLFIYQRGGGYVWDQSLFVLMALAGAVVAIRSGGAFARWAAVYAAFVAVVLSLAPYKTPWNVVNVVPALCLLGGVGLSALKRPFAMPMLAAVILSLAWQTRQAVFQRPADPRNPFAYVHAVPDVLKVPALAESAPAGTVKVISDEYWPLPWYLRGRPDVGYWTQPPEDCDGALVIAGAGQSEEVRRRLRGNYRMSYLGLRPGYVLVVFTPEQRPTP